MVKKKEKERRYRKFDVQRSYYFETHDADGNLTSDMSEREWREKVDAEIAAMADTGQYLEVLYAFHDADINTDGTPKGLHVHEVITCKDACTQTAAVKKFGASSVYNCQHTQDYAGSCQYLIHVSPSAINEMKTIYLPDKVKGWYLNAEGAVTPITVRAFQERMAKKDTVRARQEQKKVKNECAIDLMKGKTIISDVRECYEQDAKNVGLTYVDYLSEKRLFREASAEYLERVTEFYQSHPCPLTTIYISGGGGTGKTSLANAIADSVADAHGVHKVAAPGKSTTFDFAGNYKGERVSIFNELAPAFPVEQWLSVFDSLNAMPVNSRHSDKLYFANWAIFTTSVPVEPFMYELWKPYARNTAIIPNSVRKQLIMSNATEADWLRAYLQYLPPGDDKILQIRRRIPIQVTIDSGQVAISVLDKQYNSSDSFAFYSPKPGFEPYRYFRALPYDVRDLKNIDGQTDVLVKSVLEAVDYYYKLNGYKHPDEFLKPDFEDDDKK